MTPLIPKSVTDFTGYVCGGGGFVVAAFGAADANAIQAWAGAFVAAVAAIWGLWRDQKAHDRQDKQRKSDMERHDKWDSFLTEFRMKRILETGKDPFEHGPPPLDFLEAAEMAEINRNAPKVEDTHITTTAIVPEPAKPRWPTFHRIFG